MTQQEVLSIENAKAYLSKTFQLDKLIRSKLEQLARARERAFIPAIQYSHAKTSASLHTDRMAENATRVEALEAEVSTLLLAFSACKQRISIQLSHVTDLSARSVLEQRYLCHQPWEDIARKIECTKRQAYNLHNKGLKIMAGLLAGMKG